MIVAVYSDGGCVGGNPSSLAGTWAWCGVNEHDDRIVCVADVLYPKQWEIASITNNQMEMYAVVQALEYLPDGWSGRVYSDSQITLGRVFQHWRMKNIPLWLVERAETAVKRLGAIEPILLSGHPTNVELRAGVSKSGRPVSAHQVWCDEQCSGLARQVLARQTGK